MNYDSLRDFLDVLEQNGQLLRIADPVMPEPDISAAARAAINCGHYAPALLFEKVKGYANRLVVNVHGSWANHALMLGLPKDTIIKDQFFELDKRWPGKVIKPIWVKDAPCKAILTCLKCFRCTGAINMTADAICLRPVLLLEILTNPTFSRSRMSERTESR
jgi:3-polyprenyl-4-hydroxybenzoate decarboxylase